VAPLFAEQLAVVPPGPAAPGRTAPLRLVWQQSEAAVTARPAASPMSPEPREAGRLALVVPLTEQQGLVERAQQGDAAAFAELFRQHRGAVARIAFRMLGPRADLEDAVQDVFVHVFRSLPDFRGQSKFSTWLHRVAVNVVLMIRRRARSRPTLVADDRVGREGSDVGALPDEALARTRRLAAFRRLLDQLSEKKRTVFVLHEIEGMSPTEIAELVDCPVLTVRTRLFYARQELAELLRTEPTLQRLAEGWADERKEGAREKGARPKGKTKTEDDASEGQPHETTGESSPEEET
jgi:RNA polymerase sigma-70 factor (ECF subfamily)